MSYTQLKIDTANWLHRTDLDPQMDTFALLSEAMINERLKSQENQTTIDVVFNDRFFELPDDYIAARNIKIADRPVGKYPMSNVSLTQLDLLRNASALVAYAIHGGSIEFNIDIDPANPMNGEITYFAQVPTLTANATNDVLDRYPMLYLTAMLFNGFSYLQDEANASKWAGLFDTQLDSINKTKGTYVTPSVRAVCL